MKAEHYDQYAKTTASMVAMLDALGVKRAATIPYVDGDAEANHIQAVGAAAAQQGGLTRVLVHSYHKSAGRDHSDGESVLHSTDKLEQTIIPKDTEEVKTVLGHAQKTINKFSETVGKTDKTVQSAQGYLDLMKTNDGAGMNAFDFAVGIQQLLAPLAMAASRKLKMDRLADENKPAVPPAEAQEASAAPATDASAQGAPAAAEPAPDAGTTQTMQADAPGMAPTLPADGVTASPITAAGAIENHPAFAQAAAKAWATTGNGEKAGVEAGFTVDKDGNYSHITSASTGGDVKSHMKQDLADDTTLALHVHPNSTDPKPSKQDIEVAKKTGKQIYILSRDGLYGVNAQGQASLVKPGLDWMNAKGRK